jgi:hypothetical protein
MKLIRLQTMALACAAAFACAATTAAHAASPRKDTAAEKAEKAEKAGKSGKSDRKASGAAGPVVTSVPPPSGQWEAKPAPANGHIWSAGHYAWTGERYEWKPGEWIVDRAGMDYRQPQWVQRADGKWTLTGGDWVPEKGG